MRWMGSHLLSSSGLEQSLGVAVHRRRHLWAGYGRGPSPWAAVEGIFLRSGNTKGAKPAMLHPTSTDMGQEMGGR